MRVLLNARSWLVHHKERIGIIAIGHTAKRLEEVVFDWLLYGTVITLCTSWWGAVNGSLAAFFVMTPLSALICVAYLRFYDWAKKDWFGFEAVKAFSEGGRPTSRLAQMVQRIARKGSVPAFLVLSIYGDPFMVTIYLRRSTQYAGLTKRDWAIFWSSVVVSNAYWTVRWTAVVMLLHTFISLI